jgi:putative membrane protein
VKHPMTTTLPNHQKFTERLAAERTFLAWVRTSIAVISLGFVVAKFGVWLRELAARLDPQTQLQGPGISLPIGLGMMVFGGILTMLAAWHFHRVNLAIERGAVQANHGLVVTVTAGVALLTILMIAYMMLTAECL